MTETTITQSKPKSIKWAILTVVVVVGVAAGFILSGWYRYLYGPCAVPKVRAAIDEFQLVAQRFDDASEVANSAPRVSLAGPIADLQSVSRDVAAVPVPACMIEYRETFHAATQYRIDAFVLFMRDESDAKIKAAFSKAEAAIGESERELGRIVKCAPSCD